MYALIRNGQLIQYPYSEEQFRADSSISYPKNPRASLVSPNGTLVPVRQTSKPEVDDRQIAVLASQPTFLDFRWVLEWTVRDKTQAELDADRAALHADINTERQRRLALGANFTVSGVTNTIPLTGRPFDQTVYLALLSRAQNYISNGDMTTTITVRDGSDVIHELTGPQMANLVSQAMLWFEAVMATSWAMKDGTAPFEAGIPDDFTDDAHWPV